ncbi:5-formyltetrahydrofolate cyclo-ligase [Vibrio salinus]|uniref:5-formyltetrahydrofolate cyclo-ligase n=1 Tax=Vibrio salinus TaxID=2899784 RepID=UPI001E656D74|nr:5-formyltetrahydrofolate cyclo-ligase [Vibrio salinus]MCE0494101.1 5-formyltetrahydrofolate cyclo-ligase [Vibrio salinus]
MKHYFSRQEFRKQIREKRRSLSDAEQTRASNQLLEQCLQLKEVSQSKHLALYLSNDGELNTRPFIEWCWKNKKQVFIPVIHPFSKGQLLFLHYHPDSQLIPNRYGIKEPKLRKNDIIPAHELDIIFTPLVAFDRRGHRLGMGGGYYDRTLEPWFRTYKGAKPIGIAHECQFIEELPIESWDIPLPKIITPNKIWCWE